MLEMKNIRKTYVVGDIETRALDGISVAFRKKEFVAILGVSGSGKTTCLNIVGGLDRYDSGDMIIKGKQTKNFTEQDWDAYRNNSVGFVFQSYNLIMHIGIVANVELGMTLSGVSPAEKRKRALSVLEKVGLKDHLHKKPNQLSGGQMQRVAIARALANDPEILLCDEPTGALDTQTSMQIMDLIKEVAKERLVIMVTHNPSIADKYADRIINFEDGKIVSDTHPHIEGDKPDMFQLKKTSMRFTTALRLSFNNLLTKMGRTFLTAFASSIGIIGIAVIISLSSGFQTKIDEFQSDALSEFPIIISQQSASVDAEKLRNLNEIREEAVYETDAVNLYDPAERMIMHTNKITDEYVEYLNDIDPKICSSIGYTRIVNMNIVRESNGEVVPVSFTDMLSSAAGGGGQGSMMSSMSGMGLSSFPVQLDTESESYVVKNYDLVSGEYPTAPTDLILIVGNNNRIDFNVMKNLGYDTESTKAIKFSDIINKELTIVTNNNYYVRTEFGTYLPGNDYNAMYESEGNIKVRICGIFTLKEDSIGLLANGISYSDELSQMVIDSSIESDIVKAQLASDKNIMTMSEMDEFSKKSFVSYLGGNAIPFMVMVYPTNFDAKDDILVYLDDYNQSKIEEDQIIYTDLASSISGLTGGIMTAITAVLIAFASISLVVSLIMICIITYTSVLERTKEIGILRALGARKKDITRVFDAETCILGVFSGVLGVAIAYGLTIPINIIIFNMTELDNVANLPIFFAILLVIISTLLTMLGGHIPARIASKKDAVVALRTE